MAIHRPNIAIRQRIGQIIIPRKRAQQKQERVEMGRELRREESWDVGKNGIRKCVVTIASNSLFI